MFKKPFSYLLPITIFKQKSTVSQTLEVTWTNGKLVLDSKNTNYSYGSLQRILRKGLKIIGFERIKRQVNALRGELLGLVKVGRPVGEGEQTMTVRRSLQVR